MNSDCYTGILSLAFPPPKHSDYVIDDADYVVTPDNEWYILDLENKQIDKELKVKVDKDGVWL